MGSETGKLDMGAVAGRDEVAAFDIEALTVFNGTGPGVRVLADTAEARVALFGFRPGQRLPEHRASSRIWVQVVRGDVAFTAGDRELELPVGTLVHLEANVAHSVVARTDA